VGVGLASWVLVAGGLRASFAAPEACAVPSSASVRAAAVEAVGWFGRAAQPDGRFVYAYDSRRDRVEEGYNLVRHAGVALSLAQAARAGIPRAGALADRALAYARAHLVPAGGGIAFAQRGYWFDTGASALFVAALLERRATTGDRAHDGEIRALGRFLLTQVEAGGRVLAYRDPATSRAVPEETSPFYTGETFFALALLDAALPAPQWRDAAARVGRYIATERDDRERRFPPVSDHWAAYAWATLAAGGHRFDSSGRAALRRHAGLFSTIVRWEAQNRGIASLSHGPHVLGAGLGAAGEGLAGIWRAAPEAGVARRPLARRAACAAGLLVARQTAARAAARAGRPDLARGAWFTRGRTQMDDQQHGLSALLGARPLLAGAR
jgi:hypothetical protein